MKKDEIFTFTALNGVEVAAVALYAVTLFDGGKYIGNKWICYAQNRLFAMMDYKGGIKNYEYPEYEGIIVDYCIIPKYDELFAKYNDLEVAQAENVNGM